MQYPDYVVNNQDYLYETYKNYVSTGFREIWNSGESYYGELLASSGIIGLILTINILNIIRDAFYVLKDCNSQDRTLIYIIFFIFFSGFAHDYFKLGFMPYMMLGITIGIINNKRKYILRSLKKY